ncbi:hypothetical protein HPB47_027482 [Ixodes persulcatus]|uniref:Uncharacterized protein n=1 Tax=Ixodes persulcatus TaxID=34615 RepID=A0AC60PVS1_IXOPE|nr:hypothetical protein HPB47_027482 [Ixodes persulcatus]
MVQETINQEPKLSGYRVHAKGPEQGQRGICTFVRRGVNSLEHDCKGNPKLEKQTGEITDIEAWTKKLQRAATAATREIETTEDTDGKMDSRLAHLIEAKQSITNRWRQQRLNRRLRKKIAELNKKIQEHCTKLSSQQWDDMCHKADKQMHNGATWRLLRHLIDENKVMAGIVQTAIRELGEEETKKKLREKYLPETEKVVHGDYTGTENERLDRDLEPWEVRNALQRVNGKSAAGQDKVNNKTLRNLSDEAVEALTEYFNECWRAGKLPKQWKTAKMILIPKPGKPPGIEHLRPGCRTEMFFVPVFVPVQRKRFSSGSTPE